MHKTKDLDDGYIGSGKHLKRAIAKYGIDAFNKEILYVFDNEEEMQNKEKELVTEEYVKNEDTYNLCLGGGGGFSYINQSRMGNTNEQRYKASVHMTELNKDKKLTRKRFEATKNTLISRYGVKYAYQTNANSFQKSRNTIYEKYGVINPSQNKDIAKKISETMSKKTKGRGNSQYGSMWITNGIENKKIQKVDSIPDGWYKGRKIK